MIQQWAIKAEKLRKDYPGLTAVQDLDLAVAQGTVHGFLGPNGAGKSTTLRMACGLLRPTSGRILVHDFDPVTHPNEVKQQVGLLPETTPLYREMSVRGFLDFIAHLRQIPKTERKASVNKVVEQTGLGDVQNRLIGNLSKGYRQRVGIAQALVHNPKLVILDEPTAGLDPQSVVEIRALIHSLKGHKTVIFSSHILTEVEEVCDTISIIDNGVLKASGPLSEIKQAFQGNPVIKVEMDRNLTDSQIQALKAALEIKDFSIAGTQLSIHIPVGKDRRAEIVKFLTENGVGVLAINQTSPDLEEIFINMTNKAKKEE